MMKYPKLKCEDKQNTVVCSLTIQKMKDMRKEKHTYQEIADKFKVSQRTAWVHTAPTELVKNSKKQRNEAVRKEHAEKYANDPEYRKNMIHANVLSRRKRYHNDPQLRKYILELTHQYYIRTKKQ